MKPGFILVACAVTLLTAATFQTALAEDKDEFHNRRTIDSEQSLVMVGKPAPDFKLEGVVSLEPGKEFKTIALKDFKDKWLVLFFYPADFTFVCPTEIKGFSDTLASFKELNAEVVAVSTDSKWSHLAWIKRGDLGNLKYPLLADFTKEVSRAYRVLDPEQGVALRGLFIIDPKGILQYQVIHNMDVGRSVEETLRVLEALQNGGLCPLGWKPGQKTLGK
ncbi:MAG: peroxiredoxin [Proteobacteria bacterium]|nr:peroxiredoxin [Pseudomonadota bacterium]